MASPSTPVVEHARGRAALRELSAARLDPLAAFPDFAERFGDVAGFQVLGKRFFILAHPDLVRQILTPPSGAAQPLKGRALRRSKRLLGEGLLTSEGDAHLRQRRLAQPAFQPRHLGPYAATMVERTSEMCASMEPSAIIDVERMLNAVTLRIAGETMFGVDLRHREREIGDALDETRSQFIHSLHPLAPILMRLPTKRRRRFDRARGAIDSVVYDIIRRGTGDRPSDATGTDLLSLLMQARDEDGTGMTRRQLRDEAVTMLLAGHETTANALAWSLYLLSEHPEARAQVEREVQDVLGGRAPTAEDVDALPYCRAVFEESLRLFPPGAALARRASEPMDLEIPTDIRLDPVAQDAVDAAGGVLHIPRGGEMITPQWTIHRDPRWHPDPTTFRPERFLERPARELPRYVYFPFGGGRRVCIGQGFAVMEGVLVLAVLTQHFRFDLAPGAEIVPDAQFTLRPRGGMPMVPTPRLAEPALVPDAVGHPAAP